MVEIPIICSSLTPLSMLTILKKFLSKAEHLDGMQNSPLLKKLDWVFTSAEWSSEFPNTLYFPLARLGSNPVPIHVQTGSQIPKEKK
jgi:hypothetical protein